MTSEEQPDQTGANGEEVWREVGEQFHSLGKSLAGAIRTAWDDENNQRRVEQLRGGLESMVTELNGAIKDTADSPKVQNFRTEAKESFRNMRDTGEQAAVEVRPHLVKVLRQINTEIDRAISRMDHNEDTPEPEPDTDPVD
jgi:hypothetical protein